MSDDYGQTLAVFVVDTGKGSRRLLKRIQEIDDVDANVKIVDAAIADRTRFRVKVHQTEDLGGAKGTAVASGSVSSSARSSPGRPARSSAVRLAAC